MGCENRISIKNALVVVGTVLAASLTVVGAIELNKLNNNQQRSEKMETIRTDLSDYEGVKHALGLYIEAGKQGKSSIMKESFLPQAVMYGHDEKGKLIGGPIQSLFDIIDNNPPAKNLKAEITKVEIAGLIAQAQVESYDWNGARYTDMFQLVKDGSQWKVLVKEYHTH